LLDASAYMQAIIGVYDLGTGIAVLARVGSRSGGDDRAAKPTPYAGMVVR